MRPDGLLAAARQRPTWPKTAKLSNRACCLSGVRTACSRAGGPGCRNAFLSRSAPGEIRTPDPLVRRRAFQATQMPAKQSFSALWLCYETSGYPFILPRNCRYGTFNSTTPTRAHALTRWSVPELPGWFIGRGPRKEERRRSPSFPGSCATLTAPSREVSAAAVTQKSPSAAAQAGAAWSMRFGCPLAIR